MTSNKKPGQIYATISISIVLILVCLFLLLFFHTGNITNLVKERINILVELQDRLPAAEIENLKQSIQAFDGVIPGSVEYIDKKEAAQFMSGELSPINDGMENPFMDILKFNLQAAYYQESHIKELESKLELEKGVLSVYFENESIDSVRSNILKLSYIILGLTVVFSLLVLIIIHSTVRLNLYNDLREIKTMQMVGADNYFIKKPYLREGFNMTIKAFVVVIVFIVVLYLYMLFGNTMFKGIIQWEYVILSAVISFLVAFLIILLSTNGILNRFLKYEVK
jgi:cell division transport system permease protein